MLKGQISIVGIDNLSLADKFAELFTCNWDKIDCALMATGNYGQKERNGWRHQYASKSTQIAWDELLHKSANYGFDNTKHIPFTFCVDISLSAKTFVDLTEL